MAWYIASTPFWLLGVAFLFGSFFWALDPKETSHDRAKYFLGGLLMAGPTLIIAAWISS